MEVVFERQEKELDIQGYSVIGWSFIDKGGPLGCNYPPSGDGHIHQYQMTNIGLRHAGSWETGSWVANEGHRLDTVWACRESGCGDWFMCRPPLGDGRDEIVQVEVLDSIEEMDKFYMGPEKRAEDDRYWGRS